MVKIFSSIMAAMGKQLKQSVNVFHSLMLYRRLPIGSRHTTYQNRTKGTQNRMLTLIVETINSIDTCTFMVTTENEEILGVLDLVRKEKADRFQRLLSTIDIVPEEEVICFRWEAAIFEESEEVVVLPVYVAYRARRAVSPPPVSGVASLSTHHKSLSGLRARAISVG